MSQSARVSHDWLETLRASLNARAAGAWRAEGNQLVRVAFVPSPGLPEEVVLGFTAATRSVALAQTDLGIVKAVVEGSVTVSSAAQLPEDAGSGRWLRAFDATRSVAVPLSGAGGLITGVVSVALAESPLDDQAVASRIRAAAEG